MLQRATSLIDEGLSMRIHARLLRIGKALLLPYRMQTLSTCQQKEMRRISEFMSAVSVLFFSIYSDHNSLEIFVILIGSAVSLIIGFYFGCILAIFWFFGRKLVY